MVDFVPDFNLKNNYWYFFNSKSKLESFANVYLKSAPTGKILHFAIQNYFNMLDPLLFNSFREYYANKYQLWILCKTFYAVKP